MEHMQDKNTKQVIIWKGYWSVSDVRKNGNLIFVFGDNNVGFGKGGQAIIRDEPNATGIPTKKYPNSDKDSFYSDVEFDENVDHINKSIDNIKELIKSDHYIGIVLPEDGFGTGLAELPKRAPNTYKYLTAAIKNLVQFVNSL